MIDPNEVNEPNPSEETKATEEATDRSDEGLSDDELDNAAGGGGVRWM